MIKQPKLASFYGPNAEVYSAQDYEALAARLADLEAERALILQRAENAEAALVESEALRAEAELDKEHLQRAVDRACEVFRDDVLCQDIDGTTRSRVELYLAAYGAKP